MAIGGLLPEVVVVMGEYRGRSMGTVERLAQKINNRVRYALLDNAGRSMQDEVIVLGKPWSGHPGRACVW